MKGWGGGGGAASGVRQASYFKQAEIKEAVVHLKPLEIY